MKQTALWPATLAAFSLNRAWRARFSMPREPRTEEMKTLMGKAQRSLNPMKSPTHPFLGSSGPGTDCFIPSATQFFGL
jgi:hypothetical protein